MAGHSLAALEQVEVPLHGFAPFGVEALVAVLDPGRTPTPQAGDPELEVAEGPPCGTDRRA